MTVSLSTLRTRVRERANFENNEFITDSELNQYISDSYAELYDILVGKFEDYYLADPLEFTMATGSASYNLPTDFYKIIGLDRKITGNDYYTVRPFVFEDRNRRRIADKLRGLYPTVRYRILGDQLRFVPSDQAEGDYRLWYVPTYTALTADTDTIDGVNGWEDYVVVDAGIKCLIKEESDPSALAASKAALLDRIEKMAANRDAGEPQRVTDITRSGYDDPIFYR